MVTLKEIAATCGCSIATVSKALNGGTDVSRAVVARIREEAAKMGYFPNAAARTLKTNRSHVVGMLMFLREESIWTHGYFGGIAVNIQLEMEAQGYDITPIDAHYAAQRGGYLNYCRYRNYDGIILMSAGFAESNLMELVESEIPLVAIDYAVKNRSAVLSDNKSGMREMLRYAAARGHRRIAYIHGEKNDVSDDRLNSFFETARALGLEMPDDYIIPSFFNDTFACAAATHRLLELPTTPTCIFYPDDFSLIGGLNELRARGLTAPEDISVAGYDGIVLAQRLQPEITTVAQDSVGIGRQAARMLLREIERPKDFVPTHMVLPCRFVPGGTIKDLTAP